MGDAQGMGWANSQMFCTRGTYIAHLDVHEKEVP